MCLCMKGKELCPSPLTHGNLRRKTNLKPHFFKNFSCTFFLVNIHTNTNSSFSHAHTKSVQSEWPKSVLGSVLLILSIGDRLLTAAAPLITVRCVCERVCVRASMHVCVCVLEESCTFILAVLLSHTWTWAPLSTSTVSQIYHEQTKRPKPAAHFTFTYTTLICYTKTLAARKRNQLKLHKNRLA